MWLHRLRKLAGLPPAELLLLLQAQWFLWRAQLRLRRAPHGGMVAAAAESAADRTRPVAELDGARLMKARRLERAILRVAEHGPSRPLCLARAMALQAMLDAHGLRGARVVVGVQFAGGRFAAHAWVEYGPEVLGDRRGHVERYVALEGAQVEPLR